MAPYKLNDGMIQALSLAISRGNYLVTSCQLCNISENQVYLWLKQAQEDYTTGLTADDSLFIRLYESLKRAEAKAEDLLVQVVRDSATVKKEWLPAITMLERRHPDRWGRRERHDINVETKTLNITRVEVVMPQGIEGLTKEIMNGSNKRTEKELPEGLHAEAEV